MCSFCNLGVFILVSCLEGKKRVENFGCNGEFIRIGRIAVSFSAIN